MGWGLTITADKPFEEDDVRSAVESLPAEYAGWRAENVWGWSAAVDIAKPEGNTIRVSGSWGSYDAASGCADVLCDQLRQLGYEVKHGKPAGLRRHRAGDRRRLGLRPERAAPEHP